MQEELETINPISLSSHQLQYATNQKVKYGCSMHCCFPTHQHYALHDIKLTQNYLLAYSPQEQNAVWGLELNLNVTVRVDEEKLPPEKEFLTDREKVLKLRIHGLQSQIRLFSEKPEELDLLCQNLSAKPIFWSGFSTKYKQRRIICKTKRAHYLAVVSLENSKEYLVKAFNLIAFEDPQRKKQFANQVQMLKKFNIPGVVNLLKVYQSEKTVYMVYEDPGKSLSQVIAEKIRFDQQGIKIFIRTLLQILYNFHEKGMYHGNIHQKEIFFKKLQKTNQYAVKIGGFDFCGHCPYKMMGDLQSVGLILSEMLSWGPAEPHGQDLVQQFQSHRLTTSKSLNHPYLSQVKTCNLKLE